MRKVNKATSSPFIPIFKYDITEECKAMLNDKVKRFQVQHAHNLALTGMIDVAIMWNEQNIMATKVNMAGIKQAVSLFPTTFFSN